MTEYSCLELLPRPETLPSSPKSVILRLESPTSAPDAAEYAAACAARSIGFHHYYWRPDLYPMTEAIAENGTANAGPMSFEDEAITAAKEKLEWAKDRLEWCEKIGDIRSVHEVV